MTAWFIDGWMGGWMDGWMDRSIFQSIHCLINWSTDWLIGWLNTSDNYLRAALAPVDISSVHRMIPFETSTVMITLNSTVPINVSCRTTNLTNIKNCFRVFLNAFCTIIRPHTANNVDTVFKQETYVKALLPSCVRKKPTVFYVKYYKNFSRPWIRMIKECL